MSLACKNSGVSLRACLGWMVCCWLALVIHVEAAEDRVLILASYHPGHFWQQVEVDGAVARLRRDRSDLPVDVEYLDLARFASPEQRERVAPALLAKYGADKWRVVLLLDQQGLDFGLRHRQSLFPGATAVFCGAEVFTAETAAANPWVTGVIERVDPVANARLALTLQPNLGRIVVVSGDIGGAAHVEAVKAILPFRGAQPQVELFSGFNAQELFNYLETMPRDSAIIFSGFSRAQDYISEIQGRTRVPIYPLHWPTYKGLGMGGVMVDATFQGEDAAGMVLRILKGATPASIPVQREPRFRSVVDYRMLQKFGVPESRVPQDCEVRNRPESIWQAHRRAVLVTVAVFGVMTALIFGLALVLRQKQRAERALVQSERRFRHLVENSDDMVVELDPSGRIGYVSPNSRRWLGFDQAELLGRLLGEFAHPDETPAAGTIFPKQGAHRHRLKHRDGSWRWMESSVRESASGAGGSVSVVVLRDVTQRVAAEEAQMEMEGRMRQAEKMQALGTLAGGIAHDFNNLLTPIVGHATLLADSARDPDSKESAREILHAATRASDIVKGILTFGRVGANARTPLDLAAVVEESRRLLRSSLPSSIAIEAKCETGLPLVLANRTCIGQVLLNLGQNGAHAMPEGGTLVITLEGREVDAEFARLHPPLRPGRKVVLSVMDSGSGMDEATVKRIFEPFFTTKPPGRGTGLGLSVVFGIVQDHEAAITVESTVGKGACFRIYFDSASKDAIAAGPVDQALKRGHGELVLVVDDEPAIGRVGMIMLQKLGYQSELAPDPAAALKRLADTSLRTVDLVLSDLNMPGMSGRQMLKIIRERHPGQRVILTSGNAPESLSEDGFNGFLPKPYSMQSLAQAVFTCLHPGS
jgi:PAS domain S-box-containing protein